ncbi:ankyrin repeat protein [Trichoderma guizhouense]|uniref:Ankyrin repeat protein n=1 Tax=Trichoderma guizhouense TaxID=1491466 RepID=A0A1T3CYS3_9HYPO|nr:ankyrin repeat protein [Trichoderma guizhouense]
MTDYIPSTPLPITTSIAAIGPAIRRSLTFRISNIPLEVARDKLEDILTRLPKTTETGHGQSNLLRFSYSPAAVSMLAKRFAVATVTFGEAPDLGELEKFLKKAIGDRDNGLIVDSDFFGLTPLADPLQNTLVDIIAVTGLAGHAFGSWKSKSKPDMWLRDFLPISIPNARVLTYGYDTKLPGSRSKSSILQLSKKLLESIKTTRDENTKHRPLILIGHSLGGLVVKHALVQASEGSEDDLAIFRSCYAVMFFAVPNRGLDNINLMSMVKGQPNEDLVRNLGGESPFLNHLHESFHKRFTLNSEIICAFETKTTPTVEWNSETKSWERTGPEVMMVPQNSAIYAGPNEKPYDQLPIEADHSEIVKFSDSSNSDYIIIQSRIDKWVQKAPAVIRDRFRRIRTKFSDLEAQYIEALRAPDYTAFRNHKIDNPTSGTLGWFLELQQFSSWSKAQESSVLWVNGSPGQGKTIVAKFLLAYLEDLQHMFNHRTTVIYFFFYDQDDSYRTVSAAVRSLIKQLLSTQGAFDVISDKLNIKASTISDESAWDILEELFRSPVFGTIYCVIDALDECHDDESRQKLLEFIKKVIQRPLVKAKGKCPVLKAFLTSRPTTDLSRALRQFSSIHLKASYDDLKTFIQSRIQELDLETQHEGEVIDLLSSRVGQTFLWISIVLRKLKTASTLLSRADMEQMINETPSRLTDLYESILLPVMQSRDKSAQKLLIWTVFSRRALTLDELEESLAIQETSKSQESIGKYRVYLTEKSVTSAVGAFLEVADGKVYLIHQSAKDFLLKSKLLAEAEFCRGLHPNLYLAKICMTYLCFADFAGTGPCGDSTLLEKRYRQYPFFHYAARNWHRHISTDDDTNIFAGIIHQLTEIGSLGLLAWGEAAGIMALDKAEDKYDIATKANIPWLTDFQWKDHIITKEMIQRTLNSGIGGYDSLKQFTKKSGVRITEEAFYAAVKYFDHEMIRLLLHTCTGANITPAIIEVAITNERYGRFVIDLLLESGCNFEITARLVNLAAYNSGSGKDIMEIILRKVNTYISEKAMVAIAAGFSIETMNLVLSTKDHAKITSEVLSAAIKNKHGGKEMFDFLLEQSGQDTPIMEEVIELVSKKGFRDTMMALLSRRGDNMVVTDRIFEIMIKYFHDEAIELLLDRQGHQINITEHFVEFATLSLDRRVMHILLDKKGDQINVTEKIVESVAQSKNVDTMALLLDRRGDRINITEKIVEIAAKNKNKDMMALLLDRRGDKITITEEVVKNAAKNRTHNVMALLLDRRGHEIHITEEIIKAAVRNNRGEEITQLLFNKVGDQIAITEEIVKAAVRNYNQGKEITQLLFNKVGDQIAITEEIVKAAVENEFQAIGITRLLFDRGDQVVITEEIIKAAVGNSGCGGEITRLLFDKGRDQIAITEEIMKAAVGNRGCGGEITQLLFDKGRDQIVITEDIIKAAVGNTLQAEQVIQVLLDQQGGQVIITEEILNIAIANSEEAKGVLRLLLTSTRGQGFITEDIRKAAERYLKDDKANLQFSFEKREWPDLKNILEELASLV